MSPVVYIETSVVSYLTAWPSRDMLVSAYQVATREWWTAAAKRYDLLAAALVDQGAVPHHAAGDAVHIATAACHAVHYLVSWNFRHIANAAMNPHIARVCRQEGYELPFICTPTQLME